MAQFDVLWLKTRRGRKLLVVDLQSDLLGHLDTRVIAPLEKLQAQRIPFNKLNPNLSVDGQQYALVIQELVSVRASDLSGAGTSVKESRDRIIAAIDLLVTGI